MFSCCFCLQESCGLIDRCAVSRGGGWQQLAMLLLPPALLSFLDMLACVNSFKPLVAMIQDTGCGEKLPPTEVGWVEQASELTR